MAKARKTRDNGNSESKTDRTDSRSRRTAPLGIIIDGKRAKFAGRARTAGELLSSLGISSEEALVKIGGKVVPESARLPHEDAKGKIEIIRVVYGG